MATQLSLYNGALRLIKGRRLATTSDDDPSRYLLDDVYAGALAHCFELGQWAFASKSASVAGAASSNRGFSYRFTKPSDFVRLISISASSTYYPPLEAYAEDNTYWFSSESTIYITYVSDDASYGGDLTKWPETYARVVEAYLAKEISPHLTNADGIVGRSIETFDESLQLSLAKDAINRTARVLSASTLAIYNGVLRLIGKRNFTNFDDRFIARRIYDANGDPGTQQRQGRAPTMPANDAEAETVLRRLIDECYDRSVEYILSQGLWNFASRTVAIEAETDVEPTFGYTYVFEKPDDYVRVVAVGNNGSLWPPLNEYMDEGAYWNANCDPLYVQYISSGASYGGNTSLWPETFKKVIEAYLALQIAPDPHSNVSGSKLEVLNDHYKRMLRDARAKDAMNQGPQRPPPGQLSMSRMGSGALRNSYRREP